MEERCLFGDLPEKRCPLLTVLSLLVLGFLISSCHLGFVGSLSSRADFDGRVLKRGCRDGHFSTTL